MSLTILYNKTEYNMERIKEQIHPQQTENVTGGLPCDGRW